MSTSSEDGAVRITLRDVYEAVQRTHDAVTEMRGDVATQARVGADHEARIRLLERRVWSLPSVATLLAVAGIVVSVVGVIH